MRFADFASHLKILIDGRGRKVLQGINLLLPSPFRGPTALCGFVASAFHPRRLAGAETFIFRGRVVRRGSSQHVDGRPPEFNSGSDSIEPGFGRRRKADQLASPVKFSVYCISENFTEARIIVNF